MTRRDCDKCFSTSFETRLTAHWGGWSDPVIEWWHDFLHCNTFERAAYPSNAVNVVLVDSSTGKGINIRSTRFSAGDLVARTQFLIAEGGASRVTPEVSRFALSARLDFKVPLGSPGQLGGSGDWDGGLALLGTAELLPWLTAHAMVAVAAYGGLAVPVPLTPQTWHYTAELSLPIRLGAVTILAEDRVTSTLFVGGWSLPSNASDSDYTASALYGAFRPQNEVSAGVRYGAFTWWFSEDFTPGSNPHNNTRWYYCSNSPDIATGIVFSTPL